MKLFGEVIGPNIQISEYYSESQKNQIPNMNTIVRSNYLNSIQIPNYLSNPVLEKTKKCLLCLYCLKNKCTRKSLMSTYISFYLLEDSNIQWSKVILDYMKYPGRNQ